VRPSRCTLSAFSTKRLPQRNLSNSVSLQAWGPESPNYLPVPEQVQPPTFKKPSIKGVLPVARPIIDRRRRYKATEKWVRKTTPDPLKERQKAVNQLRALEQEQLNSMPPQVQQQTRRRIFKADMAAQRKSNLREGVFELYQRYASDEISTTRKKEDATLRRLRKVEAPERSDVTWTAQSIPQHIRDALTRASTKRVLTQEEKDAKIQEYQKRFKEKERKRLEAIHSLYLNAKNFITTEAQLTAEIERVFGSNDNPVTWSAKRKSVWHLGRPPGTDQLVGMEMQRADEADHLTRAQSDPLMRERIMRIAGQLTGGKPRITQAQKGGLGDIGA